MAHEEEVGWRRRLAALAVHGYTAGGAVVGLLALRAVLTGEIRAAFLWLLVAVLIDSSDGTLARRAGVKVVTPWIDGARMDDIVDYLTWVFVPVVLVYEWGLLPEHGALWIAACPLVASAYGFARTDAKTPDHFFTGFPSYWNIVALYLYLAGSPPWMNATLLVLLSALVFVPIRYVYPSRMPVLRRLTVGLGLVWGAMLAVLIWQIPRPDQRLLAASLFYPAYYLGLTLYFAARRNTGARSVRTVGS